MASEVHLACTGNAGVRAEDTQAVCREFLALLREKHPDLSFQEGDTGRPAIALTITQSNDRSLGLDVTWIAADNTRTAGKDMRTAFYDRGSSPGTRRIALESFLNLNPLPF